MREVLAFFLFSTGLSFLFAFTVCASGFPDLSDFSYASFQKTHPKASRPEYLAHFASGMARVFDNPILSELIPSLFAGWAEDEDLQTSTEFMNDAFAEMQSSIDTFNSPRIDILLESYKHWVRHNTDSNRQCPNAANVVESTSVSIFRNQKAMQRIQQTAERFHMFVMLARIAFKDECPLNEFEGEAKAPIAQINFIPDIEEALRDINYAHQYVSLRTFTPAGLLQLLAGKLHLVFCGITILEESRGGLRLEDLSPEIQDAIHSFNTKRLEAMCRAVNEADSF